jgi:SRSO17 transposase
VETFKEFKRYIAHLSEGLGHADRHAGLKGYCTGLMLPLARKSVEPMAASLEPQRVSARHQALHHFVARSEWSDAAVLARVRDWVVPSLGLEGGCYWIVDDTGFPKKGRHSVGVARQYCGQLGKQDNCQVAVSLSLASTRGSVPVAYQLYLPQEWADDAVRRQAAGVPETQAFATKPAIALEQMRQALSQGVRPGVVLADAGTAPLPPKAWVGRGVKPTKLRREPGHEPVNVKALAMDLPPQAWQTVAWREGTNAELSGRFAALRVRPAHRDYLQTAMRAEEWLLIEWPEGEKEPVKYFLSTAPEYASLAQLVFVAKMRWRIERDYQDLKQDFGLGHFEGRGWRGFHHHATLSIAAYGFLMAQRLKMPSSSEGEAKKNFAQRQNPGVPEDYVPRGSPARPAPCARVHHDAAHSPEH